MEFWKDIEGYEGLYKVSSLGHVRSLKRKVFVKQKHREYYRLVPEIILKETLDIPTNYYKVPLNRNSVLQTKCVHFLVCTAFCVKPETNKRLCTDHIDGDKANNKASNLRWVTFSENSIHRYNTRTMFLGENHPAVIISDEDADWIRTNYRARCKEFGAKALADKFGVHRTTIENIVSGRTRSFTYNDLLADSVGDLKGIKQALIKKGRYYNQQGNGAQKVETSGEGHYNSKIPSEDIFDIINEYIPRCKKHGAAAIAKRYNVSRQCIGMIIRGVNRKNG